MRELSGDEIAVISGGEENVLGSWSSFSGYGGFGDWGASGSGFGAGLGSSGGFSLGTGFSSSGFSSSFASMGSALSLSVSWSGDSDEIVVTGHLDYNPPDWCGGDNWTRYTPDMVFGVYIGDACHAHDENYGPDTRYTKAQADMMLYNDIKQTLIDAGVSEDNAAGAANIYYQGVRLFGDSFYQGHVGGGGGGSGGGGGGGGGGNPLP